LTPRTSDIAVADQDDPADRKPGWRWAAVGISVLAIGVMLSLLLVAPRRGLYSDDFTLMAEFVDPVSGRSSLFEGLPSGWLNWRPLGVWLSAPGVVWLAGHEVVMRTVAALLHLAAVCLLIGLTWRITRSRGAAIVAGMLFAFPFLAHESILWQTAASMMLPATILGLSALHLLWSACTTHGWRAWVCAVLGVASTVGAAMAFDHAVMTLVVLPFLLLPPSNAGPGRRVRLTRWAVLMAACVLALGAAYYTTWRGVQRQIQARGGRLVLDHRLITERMPYMWHHLKGRLGSDPYFTSRSAHMLEGGWRAVTDTPWILAIFCLYGVAAAVAVSVWPPTERDTPSRGPIAALVLGSIMCVALFIPFAIPSGQILETRHLYTPWAACALAVAGLIALLGRCPYGLGRVLGRSLALAAVAASGLMLVGTISAALMYRDCGRRDRQAVQAVVQAIADPCPDAVFIFVDVDLKIDSGVWTVPWSPDLYHVFEKDWSAWGSLQTAYRRKDLRAATMSRWGKMTYAYAGAGASTVRVNNRPIPLDRALFVTTRAGQAVLRHPVRVRWPSGQEFDLALPEVDRQVGLGAVTEPLTINADRESEPASQPAK
jgi:hypothetical protein